MSIKVLPLCDYYVHNLHYLMLGICSKLCTYTNNGTLEPAWLVVLHRIKWGDFQSPRNKGTVLLWSRQRRIMIPLRAEPVSTLCFLFCMSAGLYLLCSSIVTSCGQEWYCAMLLHFITRINGHTVTLKVHPAIQSHWIGPSLPNSWSLEVFTIIHVGKRYTSTRFTGPFMFTWFLLLIIWQGGCNMAERFRTRERWSNKSLLSLNCQLSSTAICHLTDIWAPTPGGGMGRWVRTLMNDAESPLWLSQHTFNGRSLISPA